MKRIFKKNKGFTLVELLVVIGILAVLAAIAIPSVAGLIEKGNVASDNQNATEMTNAVERWVGEYEIFIAETNAGTVDENDPVSIRVQNTVQNVAKEVLPEGAEFMFSNRTHVGELERGVSGVGEELGTFRSIDNRTKYPTTEKMLKSVVKNYTKIKGEIFKPKQKTMSYFYAPDAGIVLCAKTTSTRAELNAMIKNGIDAKGQPLSENTNWINITTDNDCDLVPRQ